MAKKRFYGVAGVNGYGVYNDYSKVLDSKSRINGFKVKGFPYYREARAYAINTYKQITYGSTDIYGTYNIKRLNRFYRKNPAREQNIQNRSHDTSHAETRIVPFTINK